MIHYDETRDAKRWGRKKLALTGSPTSRPTLFSNIKHPITIAIVIGRTDQHTDQHNPISISGTNFNNLSLRWYSLLFNQRRMQQAQRRPSQFTSSSSLLLPSTRRNFIIDRSHSNLRYSEEYSTRTLHFSERYSRNNQHNSILSFFQKIFDILPRTNPSHQK